jgi:hypothetical protein
MPVISKGAALALGVVLAVLEVVQQSFISASGGVHDAISLAVVIIAGVGVAPLAPSAIKRLVPVHVAAYLTAAVGILDVVQRTQLDMTKGVHGLIGGTLVLLAAVGFAPVTVDHPSSVRRQLAR